MPACTARDMWLPGPFAPLRWLTQPVPCRAACRHTTRALCLRARRYLSLPPAACGAAARRAVAAQLLELAVGPLAAAAALGGGAALARAARLASSSYAALTLGTMQALQVRTYTRTCIRCVCVGRLI